MNRLQPLGRGADSQVACGGDQPADEFDARLPQLFEQYVEGGAGIGELALDEQ